jgi:hypothetical protein
MRVISGREGVLAAHIALAELIFLIVRCRTPAKSTSRSTLPTIIHGITPGTPINRNGRNEQQENEAANDNRCASSNPSQLKPEPIQRRH